MMALRKNSRKREKLTHSTARTVGELRKFLAKYPDSTPILIPNIKLTSDDPDTKYASEILEIDENLSNFIKSLRGDHSYPIVYIY